MKMRMTLLAVAIAAVAASALAQLSPQFADWAKGPVQFLMTDQEQAQWKNVKTDAEAQAFIDLFWARRDPTPGTPANEFRDEFESRVAAADKAFASGRTRGALTDRGKLLILFGMPTKRSTSGAPTTGHDDRGFGYNEDSATASGSQSAERSAKEVWRYEGDRAQKAFGAPAAQINFLDQFNTGDFRAQRGGVDLKTAQQNAIQAAITQPNLTAPPKYTAPSSTTTTTTTTTSTTTTTTAPAAPMYATTFKNGALQTAVSDFEAAKTNPYKNLYVTYGEYVTATGEYFVPVQLYVPKVAGMQPSDDLTFFGVVEDTAGKPIAVFEEPAKLAVSKDDLYFDKSLMLPAGKHKAVFGLAQNGKPLSMVQTEMNLAGTLDKDAPGISSLILSNNVYPLAAAQHPDDPYAFGGIKVVPKGDRTFTTADELWYFFELRNPGLDDKNQPNVQVKVTMSGTTKEGKKVEMTSPPSVVPVIELKGVPGHYGVGSSINLASIKPGDYTLSVKVTDTVKKTNYTLSDNFKVVPASTPAAAK
jgi:GWxTD domain-containing protein